MVTLFVLLEVLIAEVIKIPVLCALILWWLINDCQSSGDAHTSVCAVSRQKERWYMPMRVVSFLAFTLV